MKTIIKILNFLNSIYATIVVVLVSTTLLLFAVLGGEFQIKFNTDNISLTKVVFLFGLIAFFLIAVLTVNQYIWEKNFKNKHK